MVHIVDDDLHVRKSLALLVSARGMRAHAYESAEDFLDRYRPRKPECLILDMRMPGMDGLALCRELRRRDIVIPTLFLTGYGEIRLAVRAVQEGALDFIEKPFENEHLLERIGYAIGADADREEALREKEEAARLLSRLTTRERQVIDLLVEGKISKVIAAELKVSLRTIESHRRSIMRKTEVDSLADVFKLVLTAEGGMTGTGEA